MGYRYDRHANLAIVAQRKDGRAPRSMLEEEMVSRIKQAGLPAPQERDYRICAHASGGTGKGTRKRLEARLWSDWEVDLAWPDLRIGVEVEGLGVARKNKTDEAGEVGRHQSFAGFDSDCRKYNVITIELGWLLVRVTRKMIRDGSAIRALGVAFARRNDESSDKQE
jgi:hypothetical protein